MKKRETIAERCANAKCGVVTVKKYNTEAEADNYVRRNQHKLRPKVVSVEIAPNDMRFEKRLFAPILYYQKYDGLFVVYAIAN